MHDTSGKWQLIISIKLKKLEFLISLWFKTFIFVHRIHGSCHNFKIEICIIYITFLLFIYILKIKTVININHAENQNQSFRFIEIF